MRRRLAVSGQAWGNVVTGAGPTLSSQLLIQICTLDAAELRDGCENL